ncbi:MAG: tRNA uridine-5-carboxymethylaminomethyl(34) synthesis GTPase MnmE [Nitrospinae bacterium]|nr:tRNA uridine-5-carboxymethylaminomethyl(34) synthesis GTPase MnmE [Nitrospinota bacterium]
MNDTIAAIATPPGEGGIGVIRLSGNLSPTILARQFKSASGKPPGRFLPQRVYFGEIRDPGTNLCVDEVLAVYFKAPRSYTCEDIVEISSHGGPFVVSKILRLVLDAGARLAEPGEFTRRAFLNGRIDLSQAEAVADLIAAASDAALRSAVAQLQGKLSARLTSVYDGLLGVLTQLEAAIDFPEEGLKLQEPDALLWQVRRAREELDGLICSYRQGKIDREGARVALAGKPNVGKSSLLNALLKEDRAIVTPHPGTTRDLIEERVRVKDIHINIVDSAGLRHNPAAIEAEGISRTRAALARADLALVVFDGSQPLGPDDNLLVQEAEGKSCLIVVNKSDLPEQLETSRLVERFRDREFIRISAKTGAGMDRLIDAIHQSVTQGRRAEEPALVTRERHREQLRKANDALDKAGDSLEKKLSEELIAVDIQMALDSIGAILGKTFAEDLLDQIFGQFCIGK